jgi:hypothetical protein
MSNKTNITETEHDPHPSTEEHYDRNEHPGGARGPLGHDIGPNDAVHDGHAQPRPNNSDRSPK